MTSRCVYCGSSNFGNGCRYSPKGVHMHPDDPKRCTYCGSTNYGKGCRYSPDGVHIHGIQFNNMMKEHVSSLMTNNILLYLLNKPIVEFEAYKLNIINEDGVCIKKPTTTEELNSYTNEVRTILQLKKLLGIKLDILNSTLQLESSVKNRDIDQSKQFYYQEQLDGIFNDLCMVIEQAQADGVPNSMLFNFIKT